VTSAGNVDQVVTPLCTFRKEGGYLIVDSIHPYTAREQLAKSTGFAIRNLDQAPVTPPPTAAELSELNRLDPEGVRRSEFPSGDLSAA